MIMGASYEAVQTNTYRTTLASPGTAAPQSDGTTSQANAPRRTYAGTTTHSHKEQSAIARTLAGDLNAFNELVALYQNLAYSVAYRMLNSHENASDAVQESFIKAYRALASFRNESGSFKSWLMRIVTNTCYDAIRRNSRVVWEEIGDDAHTDLDGLHGDGGTSQPHQLVDTHESPQDYLERMELSAQIELGLRALPAEQRLALLLFDVHGYSYEEIRQITGLPMGTLKSRISRARQKMRDYLYPQQSV